MRSRTLVATDGASASAGALRLARALAARQGGEVRVLTVIEPLPLSDPSTGFPLAGEGGVDPRDAESRVGRIRELLGRIGGEVEDWPLEVAEGVPGRAIVRRAHEWGATLIALGIGRQGPAGRALGDETAVQVVRLAHVPVFAAHPDLEALPRRAAVGVDFSSFSAAAARLATDLLAEPARVTLVHAVRPAPGAGDEQRNRYREFVRGRLEAVRREINLAGEVATEIELPEGEPARSLVSLASERGIGLVGVGSHGRSFLGRILLGSVSTKVLRTARCSVLVVPPADVPREVEAMEAGEAPLIPAGGEARGRGRRRASTRPPPRWRAR